MYLLNPNGLYIWYLERYEILVTALRNNFTYAQLVVDGIAQFLL